MALRSAKCYRKHERPNTRVSVRKPRRSYVKGVPGIKIHRFEHGNVKKKFDTTMYMVARQPVQIRHNALESARISVSKELQKKVGEEGFFLKVLVYPHHVLRENPLATGAGADRFQTGMRKSFGRPISRAARVREGQRIVEIRLDKVNINFGKKALKIGAAKVPTACRTEVVENK
ncbi:MAG: 50S ribosomal protein L16 [Candidatus Aenigmarchaeota archaeon]|nr:50S ribosomal protein L16 [Candidatus Aenigmarchaeota archaeon]